MSRYFHKDGIYLRYPETWAAELEEAGDSWTLILQSPEIAFFLISLRPEAPNAEQLAEETLEALRADYPQLDAREVIGEYAGQPALGHDIEFISIDTCVTCWTRCLEAAAGPLLVMGQTCEYDHEQNDLILKQISLSLRVED